jgi:hypothetical protein
MSQLVRSIVSTLPDALKEPDFSHLKQQLVKALLGPIGRAVCLDDPEFETPSLKVRICFTV